MTTKQKVKIVKSKDKPETKLILAETITEISKGMKKLLGSGLNRKAIVVLLRNSCQTVSQRDITDVLDALEELSNRYCR